MGDQFNPVIVAYGSVSDSKNKAKKLVPVSRQTCKSPVIPGLPREKKDKLKQLTIVQTINLASSPNRKTNKQVTEDEVIALSPPPAQSTSGSRSTKDKGVSTNGNHSTAIVNLDDDVITLSPDLVPFSIPEHSELSQHHSESSKVLAVVTLEESSPPTNPPVSDTFLTTVPSVSNTFVATGPLPVSNTPVEDPLQIVITLPESPDLITLEDSPPEVIMDTGAGVRNVHDLMEQINELIVKNESSEKNQSKAIAKVTSRLGNADPVYVQSEEFATLVETAIKQIKKEGTTLYAQLKIILEKLKCSTQANGANVTESSTTPSLAPSDPAPSTSGRKHVTPTRLEAPKLNQSPITLDTSSLKRYDKANYVKALEWFEQLISIIEQTEPDTALCSGIVTKLRTRLEKAEKKYLYSSLFLDTLKFSINGILTDPGKIYGFIRQTVDELKANMKCPDSVQPQPQPSTSKAKQHNTDDNDSNQSDQGNDDDENSNNVPPHKSEAEVVDDVDEGLDDKTRAHIKKLEKTLKKLEKVIRKLDQEECWGSGDEEDENSAYIKQERYMERYMKIFGKILELRGRKSDLGRPVHSKVRFDCTEYLAINRTIERFYNKTHQFPDYGDMLGLVQKVSETSKLCLSSAAIQHIAEKAFTSLGEILKQRRMEDDYDVFITRLGTAEDPAAHDEELARKLEENKKHWGKIDEVINKYVVIQEEKKKKREDNEGKEDEEKEEEEDEDEDDEEDKEKDNDSELDKDGGDDDSDSENEKENNTAESNDEGDNEAKSSDTENKRRKLQERRGSDNENKTKPKQDNEHVSKHRFITSKQYNWSQSKINSVLEEHNIILHCRVELDDCVELYHNSPDKEESFFKYLKLEKRTKEDGTDDDEEQDAEMKENESETRETENGAKEKLETKHKEMGSKENNTLGSNPTEKEEKSNRDLKHAKRKLPTEYGETSNIIDENSETVKTEAENSETIKIKTEVEDQDEIVTSTTREMEDEERFKVNEENNLKSATCDSLNDSSGDSTICVTSSMHGSEPMDVEEIENNDANDETKAKVYVKAYNEPITVF
uniref:Death domain-associated protein 6 n=1 Tax=Cacopsylla melanoneura TaxID=428564 RepID=A0A8D9BWF0_9HEMI